MPVEWKQMRVRALPWAVALALLMISTPQYFWLWMPVAGAAVVWLHSLRNNETISARAGIRAGAFVGAVAFAVWGAVLGSSIAYDRLVLHRPDRVTQGLRQSLEQAAARNPDPQVQQRVIELLSNPEGMGVYFLVSIVIMFLLFVLLCATGGALGATLSGRRSGP